MKKIITLLLIFSTILINCLQASAETLYRLKPLSFDISNALLFIPVSTKSTNNITESMLITKSKDDNSVTLEISSASIAAQPDNLFFSEGELKELQITSNSANKIKFILYFKEGYNLANLKIGNINNNIVISIKPLQPYNMSYYLNTYSESSSPILDFKESLIVSSRNIEKSTLVSSQEIPKAALNEINQAFINSNSLNSEICAKYEITNHTQNNVLRSRFYLNNLTTNGNLFTVSGVGVLGFEKQFILDNPSRMVFDIPNSLLKTELHNKEFTLTNGDKIKVAQFTPNTTRLVITSNDATKYIPIYFSDSQKAYITSPQNLIVSDLPEQKVNITKTAYQKSGKYSNLIFEFDKPLVYSIKRMSDKLYIYFLNAEKFDESSFNNVIKSTPYSQSMISIMKNTGLRFSIPTENKSDLNTYISPEGRVFKISFEEVKPPEPKTAETELQKVKKREGTIISTPRFNNPKGSKIIVLDAGHGGKDCGATRDGIYEKDITLDVCDRLQAILQKKGYKVYMTRTNDTYVSLEDRALFNQNINPAIFVSVHVNSCNDSGPKGIETHYYTDDSVDLGALVNASLTRKISYTANRGLLKSRFYVINHTEAPAILVEIGFISNTEERNSLITPQRKQQTAEGIAEGIFEYFNSKK